MLTTYPEQLTTVNSAPGLLISVKNLTEALIAVQSGADIVDVKEPAKGALGAASLATMQVIGEQLHGKTELSVALGECFELGCAPTRIGSSLPAAFKFAKIGLAHAAGKNWQHELLCKFENLPSIQNRVLVSYADWQRAEAPSPEEVIESVQLIKAKVILIDTYIKDETSTFDHLTSETLQSIMQQAAALGIKTVIAGGLTLTDIPVAASFQPDLIAVRGAACDGDRTSEISGDAILKLKQILKSNSESCV